MRHATACGLALLVFNAHAQSHEFVVQQDVAPWVAAAGDAVNFEVRATNLGPDPSGATLIRQALDAGLLFQSLTQTTGPVMNCQTPAPGSSGDIECAINDVAAGQTVTFLVATTVADNTPAGAYLGALASTQSSADATENSQTVAAVQISPLPTSDLVVELQGPLVAAPGATLTYQVQIANAGDGPASQAVLNIRDQVIGAGLQFISLTQTSGPTWACSTPAVGNSGQAVCSTTSFAAGQTATFTASYRIDPALQAGELVGLHVEASADDDRNTENNSAASGLFAGNSDTAISISAPASTGYGSDFAITIDVSNAGPDAALDTHWRMNLPAGTTFVSLAQTSGPAATCSWPAAGAGGSVHCVWALWPAAAQARFVLTLNSLATSSMNTSAAVVSSTYDGVATNNLADANTAMTGVPLPPQPIPATGTWALALLAGLMVLWGGRQKAVQDQKA